MTPAFHEYTSVLPAIAAPAPEWLSLASIGFKDWALVCAALGLGPAELDLAQRAASPKDGTGFASSTKSFFLFPTQYHQQAERGPPRSVRRSGPGRRPAGGHRGNPVFLRGGMGGVDRRLADARDGWNRSMSGARKSCASVSSTTTSAGLQCAFGRVYRLEPVVDVPGPAGLRRLPFVGRRCPNFRPPGPRWCPCWMMRATRRRRAIRGPRSAPHDPELSFASDETSFPGYAPAGCCRCYPCRRVQALDADVHQLVVGIAPGLGFDAGPHPMFPPRRRGRMAAGVGADSGAVRQERAGLGTRRGGHGRTRPPQAGTRRTRARPGCSRSGRSTPTTPPCPEGANYPFHQVSDRRRLGGRREFAELQPLRHHSRPASIRRHGSRR